MFWKLYFWAYVALSLISAYGYATQYLTLLHIFGIFVTLLIGMGIYSHAFSKHFFNKQVWAMLFYFVTVVLTLEVIYYLTGLDVLSHFLVSHYIIGLADWAVTSVVLLPALFALYLLGHKMPTQAKKKK